MGLYWNTLQINKKYENVPVWIKRFLRGASVNIITTTRCNLTCEECPMFLYGQPKNYPESTLEQWQTFFRRFPMWISQVYLSGGETSLYPHIVPLANWLIDRGHHVCLFSNLWKPEAFIGIKKHWCFVLYPTFHSCDNWERFDRAQKMLSKHFRVLPREFHGQHKIKQTELFTDHWFKNTDNTIHFPPDAPKSLKMFIGCSELYRNI
jgi:hypothetical protein